MDLITHMPETRNGLDCITTFVDRFSNRIHLVPSRSTDTATDFADSFIRDIFRLQGLPNAVLSDRNPKFTSKFWIYLMKQCGIQSKMSTSHHPQTDGATEIMNRTISNYLKCYFAFHQCDWGSLLFRAEFPYNFARVDLLNMSPFEANRGRSHKSSLD